MTLLESSSFNTFLEKVNQLGWYSTPTKYSLFLLNELEIK